MSYTICAGGFRVVAAAASVSSAVLAQPTVVQWASDSSGNWSDPQRWSPQQVPNNSGSTTFDARITATGDQYTVTLDTTNTVTHFLLDTNSGQLMGASGQSLTVEGTATLRQATLISIDAFASRGTLLLETSVGDIIICDVCIDHSGSALWSGSAGDLVFDNGGEFLNGAAALFDITNDRTARWTGVGAASRFVNDGVLRKSGGTGTTLFTGLEFINNGRIEVLMGKLSIDGITITAGKLGTGLYHVANNSEFELPGEMILENGAGIEMEGQGSVFTAIDTLELNAAEGQLIFDDRDFTTAGNFENLGLLRLASGSEFEVQPGRRLRNYRGISRTLRDGEFDLEGVLRFDGADVRRIQSDVSLVGAGADIVDENGSSALAQTDTIGKTGRLSVEQGRDFTTGGDFVVEGNGELAVGSNTLFDVTGDLGNYQQGTMQDGRFTVGGTLRFGTAGIDTINNAITLDGSDAQIVNQNGSNALAPLSAVGPQGHLTLRNGHELTISGDLLVQGRVTVGPDNLDQLSRLIVQDSYIQENKRTTLDTGEIQVGVSGMGEYVQISGQLIGRGTILGSVNSQSIIDPSGFDTIQIGGDLRVDEGFRLKVDVGLPVVGLPSALNDVLVVDGLFETSGPAVGVLKVTLVNYVPAPGEFFDVMFWGTREGQFEAVVGQIPGGLRFEPMYLPDRLRLVVVPSPWAWTMCVPLMLMTTRRRR